MYIARTRESELFTATVQVGAYGQRQWQACSGYGFNRTALVYSVGAEEFKGLSSACAELYEALKADKVRKIEFGNGGLEEMAFEAIMLHCREG